MTKVVAQIVTEGQQQPEMIEGSDRRAGSPTPADIQDEATVRLQDALDLLGKGQEPLDIFPLVLFCFNGFGTDIGSC